MRMHCVYCGETIQVSTVLFMFASDEEKALRLAFEEKHDSQCGEKSVGGIGEL